VDVTSSVFMHIKFNINIKFNAVELYFIIILIKCFHKIEIFYETTHGKMA